MNKRRDEIATRIFSLTDEGVSIRNTWRSLIGFPVWFILSGLTILLSLYGVQQPLHILIIAGMGLVKYIPILVVAYALAKKRAAQYLQDVYELEDEDMAVRFMEEVAFGYGYEQITIKEGQISEEDELSSIILIGGPGKIHVHLGNAALLEKVNGDPSVIYPRKDPWKLGRFERIREIGKDDEPGKREYAFINLRDQFISDLSVKSRTKDGIEIEAHDIKAIFSIERKPPQEENSQPDPFSFEPKAVENIVYKQIIVTPEPLTRSNIAYPWDITAVPLIISELENLITSRTLSEILATIGQKEIDQAFNNDQTIAQMRVEVTGQMSSAGKRKESSPPNFESRSKITAQFYDLPFKEKASAMGISLQWIDIGTWKIPSAIIQEKHTEAGNLMRENANQRNAIKKKKERFTQNELTQLFKNVVMHNFERTSSRRGSGRELDQFMKQNTIMGSFIKSSGQKVNMDSTGVALDILKAFRKELVSGRALIERDNENLRNNKDNLVENEKIIRKNMEHLGDIDKALHNINQLTNHWI